MSDSPIRRIIWNPCFTVYESVFRGDATRHSLRRNVTLAGVQYPRSSSSSRERRVGLSSKRSSRKIYLETVMIIMRIVLRRERIVPRPGKFFSVTRTILRDSRKTSHGNFSRRSTEHERENCIGSSAIKRASM